MTNIKSLNRVQLIGNVVRDPEVVKTNTGASICQISVATNRNWVTEAGEKREETEYHKVVAWQKLADRFGELLHKGSKVYIDGRLLTRKFVGQDGVERTNTEIVANDMIALDKKEDTEQTEAVN